MTTFSIDELTAFIVRAKAATYVGNGAQSPSCRPGSHDLTYQEENFTYLDSYFGGADFIGEEVVYFHGKPVWAENYYGRILLPERIQADEAGQMIKASLSRMYQEGRFLGGFKNTIDDKTYLDQSDGETAAFNGLEQIWVEGQLAYQLVYHGGVIR